MKPRFQAQLVAAALAVAGLLGASSSSGQTAAESWRNPKPYGPPRRLWTWDLNLEGGLGHAFADDGGFAGFGRVRGGGLNLDVNDLTAPMFSFGFFADGSNLAREVAWGAQGEVAFNQIGLWGQLGAGLDFEPNPMAMIAVGWSIFGFEAQVRVEPDEGVYPVLLGKLRAPIGIGAAVSRWNYPGRRRVEAATAAPSF